MKNINNRELTLTVLNYLHKKKATLFEFYNLLHKFKVIEGVNPELDDTMLRKIRAWKQLLIASGCKHIKNYKNHEYWSKADDIEADLETLQLFSEIGSNPNSNSHLKLNNELDSDVDIFWRSFQNALNSNIRGPDGKQRILSIIAEMFGYLQLNRFLNVSNNLINAARIHARLYGEGGQILEEDKVKITKDRVSTDILRELDTFLSDKNNVTMSSYKTDPKTGNPIYYLRSTKNDMWEKYHEEYPNGLKRTSFMCRLDGQFVYKEDLGVLCITCDFYGYQVFDSLIELICNSQLQYTLSITSFWAG